jgi:hypothetical protein
LQCYKQYLDAIKYSEIYTRKKLSPITSKLQGGFVDDR